MLVFQKTARSVALLLAISGLVIGAAQGLRADALPNDYTSAYVYLFNSLGSNTCFKAVAVSTACVVDDSPASAIVNDGNGGMARVRIGDSGGSGYAGAAYSFAVFGSPVENVPILIEGFSEAIDGISTDQFYGYASYSTYEAGQPAARSVNYFASQNGCDYIASFSNDPCQAPGDFLLNRSVRPNTVYTVILQAAALGPDSSAFIDPMITIDPSFVDASQFTLVASPGVFAATPEPSYVPVLSVAALALCCAQCRKKTSMKPA